jgi:hypothetical protein
VAKLWHHAATPGVLTLWQSRSRKLMPALVWASSCQRSSIKLGRALFGAAFLRGGAATGQPMEKTKCASAALEA